MAVEIREIVLTARVVEERPRPAPLAGEPRRVPREVVEACLAEVRRLLARQTQR